MECNIASHQSREEDEEDKEVDIIELDTEASTKSAPQKERCHHCRYNTKKMDT